MAEKPDSVPGGTEAPSSSDSFAQNLQSSRQNETLGNPTITVKDSTGGSASSSPLTMRRTNSRSTDSEQSALRREDGSGFGGDESASTKDSEGEKDRDTDPLKRKSKDKKATSFFSPRRSGGLLNIFSASHRQKNNELHKIFTALPASEKLIDDYSCALQRDILIHGRLYVTQRWLCFYANIFSWETLLTIPFQTIQAITKEKTALIIPNAIQISTSSDKYGFSSLVNRDVTYNIIFKCWQNSLLNHPHTPLELVQAARKAHGESIDVGDEQELWGPTYEDSSKMNKQVSMPTHLEIGLIPSTAIPSSSHDYNQHGVAGLVSSVHNMKHSQSLPAGTAGAHSSHHGLGLSSEVIPEVDGEASKETQQVAASSSIDHVAERVSLGGDSMASSEYETVSLIEETGEVPCGCSEHIGRTVANDVYACDVETMFKLLFTDSDFMRNFYKEEKTVSVEIGEWQSQSDGTRFRDLSYTLALNYSFGPKFCHTTEQQTYSKAGQPGLKHIVDTEVFNHNIPYSDTFYVTCRYCITRAAHNKTRLRVTANIKFKKTCWGLVKNLIERNAGDGLRTHYTHLDLMLKEHVVSLPAKRKRAHRKVSRHSSRSRHKRQTSLTQLPPIAQIPGGDTPPSTTPSSRSRISVTSIRSFPMDNSIPESVEERVSADNKKGGSLPRVNLALTLLLGMLIVSNVFLYHHLMSYHSPTPSTTTLPGSHSSSKIGDWPTTNEDWIKFLKQQLEGRNQELQHWQETLYGFVQALDDIESTVVKAKKQLLVQMEWYHKEQLFKQKNKKTSENEPLPSQSDTTVEEEDMKQGVNGNHSEEMIDSTTGSSVPATDEL